MVYKVSKGGVRSGNTLRGLRSHKIKRNTRHGCMVGRSNLKPAEIPKMLETHIEDPSFSSSLESTDVVLSLNKRKRWLLPATVGHMIQTGSLNEEKTMVSLLERHKLKRKANCVKFVCNKGTVHKVDSPKKKYFSFNIDNIGSVHSNRQLKRQKAELLKQIKPPKIEITKQNNKAMKTMEVFTVSGTVKVSDVKKSSKPEYRLEVFHPCPQTCSLTYNPKYSNAHLQFGEEGEMLLKSEKKAVKKGKRHRRKPTLKNLKIYDAEFFSSAEEFWDESLDEREECNEKIDVGCDGEDEDCLKQKFSHSVDTDDKPDFGYCYRNKNENLLACLIAKAEKARSLCENIKIRRRRKNSKNSDYESSSSESQDKSHIVYINEALPKILVDPPQPKSRRRKKKPRQKKVIAEKVPPAKVPPAKVPPAKVPCYLQLHTTRIIFKTTDTTPENLRSKFGRFYAEAESEPRRFLIDITQDIQNLLCPYRDTEQSAVYTSFLIFVYDGVYDQGLDAYKMLFNSNCCTETKAFYNFLPFKETSFEVIMNQIANVIVDMKEDNLLDFDRSSSCGNAFVPLESLVNDLFKVSITTFRSFDEIRRVAQTEILQEKADFASGFVSVERDLDLDIFCDICYENINPTQTLDISGTKLSKCGHNFCDECWRTHLLTKLKNGAVNMVCPGYDCDQTVGPVTLLSLLQVSEVSKFFQRKCEDEADSCSNSRWCPNPKCGRLIKLDIQKPTSDITLDITCSCGQQFCFSCLSRHHWPASCEQAQKYDEKLRSSLNFTSDENLEDTAGATSSLMGGKHITELMEVEGRLCPECSKFINKNGGCQHMSCRCGFQFCWICMKDWYNHNVCIPNESQLFESTLKLKVRHLAIPAQSSYYSEDNIKPQKNGETRQKTPLYKKAMQERQEQKDSKYQKQVKEMVKHTVYASRKDLLLKREVLTICGENIEDIDNSSLPPVPMASHLTKFLRSCCGLKRALHHVAEFTFVLVQDAPDSMDRRRALRLANDMSGYCCFIKSILEVGEKQDMRRAVKRLADIQVWAKRALTVLMGTVNKLKY